jgi:hypothetical protein
MEGSDGAQANIGASLVLSHAVHRAFANNLLAMFVAAVSHPFSLPALAFTLLRSG